LTAGHALLSGNLRVYAEMPEAQMGPLALVMVAGLPRWALVGLLAVGLPLLLRLIVAPLVVDRRSTLLAMLGVLPVLYPWAMMGITGHADDALVFLGAAGVLWRLRQDRDGAVCFSFVIAFAGKPTAILLLPLLFIRSPRLAAAGLALGGALWAPFALADFKGFLVAGAGITTVWSDGLPGLLGYSMGSAYPVWDRPLQLVGGLALCWYVARRRTPAGAVLAAFAFRALLEPTPLPAYSVILVLVALVVDLQRHQSLVLTAAAFLTWWVSHAYLYPHLVAAVRTPLLMLLVVSQLGPRLSRRVAPEKLPAKQANAGHVPLP